MIILCIVSSIALSVFHMGVERSWWQYDSTCSNSLANVKNIEDFQSMLNEADVVPCTTPALIILGLSMVEWNALYSFFLLIIYLVLLRGDKKRTIR